MLDCWVYLACCFIWPSNWTQVWQVQLTVQEVGVSVAVEHPPLQSAGTLWPDAHCGHQSVCMDTYPSAGKHQGNHQQWEPQVHVNKQQHCCSHHHSCATSRPTPRSVLLPLSFASQKLFYRGLENKSCGSAPSTIHYVSPCRILPYIPLQLSSHSADMTVDSGNYVITFTSYKCLGLFDKGQNRLEGNTTVGIEGRPWGLSSPLSMGLLSGASAWFR